MNLIYTVLVALPLGYLVRQRSSAVLWYLLADSYVLGFQHTSVLLDWLGHRAPYAFGPPPDRFPAVADTGETLRYAAINVLITAAGVGLVLLGAALRSRRAARRRAIAVG